jgi:hypothetical protein
MATGVYWCKVIQFEKIHHVAMEGKSFFSQKIYNAIHYLQMSASTLKHLINGDLRKLRDILEIY